MHPKTELRSKLNEELKYWFQFTSEVFYNVPDNATPKQIIDAIISKRGKNEYTHRIRLNGMSKKFDSKDNRALTKIETRNFLGNKKVRDREWAKEPDWDAFFDNLENK